MLQHAGELKAIALSPVLGFRVDIQWMVSCYENKVKQIRAQTLVGWFLLFVCFRFFYPV